MRNRFCLVEFYRFRHSYSWRFGIFSYKYIRRDSNRHFPTISTFFWFLLRYRRSDEHFWKVPFRLWNILWLRPRSKSCFCPCRKIRNALGRHRKSDTIRNHWRYCLNHYRYVWKYFWFMHNLDLCIPSISGIIWRNVNHLLINLEVTQSSVLTL